jgi:hypothetical protein
MLRTQIYLTEDERKMLAILSKETGQHLSALIREAIDQYIDRILSSKRKKRKSSAAGLWANRDDLPDMRTLRNEFDR